MYDLERVRLRTCGKELLFVTSIFTFGAADERMS